MGASTSVKQPPSTSKWKILKKKKNVLTKDTLRVLNVIHTELDKPIDGSDMPEESDRLKYHALNEVRRLRQRLVYATTVPEHDVYTRHLTKAAASRAALQRNPEKVQRTKKYNQLRKEKGKEQYRIQLSSEKTAVEYGMYAGGILRDGVCSTPRLTSKQEQQQQQQEEEEEEQQEEQQEEEQEKQQEEAEEEQKEKVYKEEKIPMMVPYAIFLRRAIINLVRIC